MDMEELLAALASPAALAWTLGILLAVFGLVWMLRRVTSGKSDSWIFVRLLVVIAALIATSVTAAGMWRYFEDVFKIENVWLRAAMFAFIEIAMLTEALLARRYRLANEGRRNADAYAVWALALLSGFLAATDARDWREALGRFAPPLVAAWLWERFLAAEIDAAAPERNRIHWRISTERVAVWLRLADATEQDTTVVDRHRRLAGIATLRFHLEHRNDLWNFLTFTEWRYRRAVIQANRLLDMATDPAVVRELQGMTAVLYGLLEATGADAVQGMAPWEVAAAQAAAEAAAAEAEQDAAARAAERAAAAQDTAETANDKAAHAWNLAEKAAAAAAATEELVRRNALELQQLTAQHVTEATDAHAQAHAEATALQLQELMAGLQRDLTDQVHAAATQAVSRAQEQEARRAAFEQDEAERRAATRAGLEALDGDQRPEKRTATEPEVRQWLAAWYDENPDWEGDVRSLAERLMADNGCKVNSRMARRLKDEYDAGRAVATDDAPTTAGPEPVTPPRSALPDDVSDELLAGAGQR
jgi:hypothetical protein